MARASTTVRAATVQDVPELVTLCLIAREEAGTGTALCTDDSARLHDQLATALGLPGVFLLVATHDGETEGLLLGRAVGPTLFSDTSAIDLEALYVRKQSRRRGIGHALLGELVALAEQAGATEVFSGPLPGARGVQRFLARIGFQPAASYRIASTASLQRRLAAPQKAGRSRQSRPSGISRLIALRRRERGDLDPGEVPGQSDDSSSMQVNRAVEIRRPEPSSTTIS